MILQVSEVQRITFSIKSSRKVWVTHMGNNRFGPLISCYTIISYKWIKDVSVKEKNTLEDSIEDSLPALPNYRFLIFHFINTFLNIVL